MIHDLLVQLEQSPARVFYERDLRERFQGEFDAWRAERLLRRASAPRGVRELVQQGRRLIVVEHEGAILGLDPETWAEPATSLVGADVDPWEVNRKMLAERFRVENHLGSQYTELDKRLDFIGDVREPRRTAIVLAFLAGAAGRGLLPVLPDMLSSTYDHILVFCPSFEPDPVLARRLEACSVDCRTLDRDRPFVLDLEASDSARGFLLRRQGGTWCLRFEGREITVKDSKGIAYIGQLLARPDQPISALELSGSRLVPSGSRGQVLDAEAVRSIRGQAAALQAEMEEAAELGDAEGHERLRDELESIAEELKRSTGIGRKPRQFTDDAERARQNVTRAIDRAIEAVEGQSRDAGAFLRSQIKPGLACRYISVPGIAWSVEVFHPMS